MTTLNAFIISSLAGLSTLIGSIVIFFNIKRENINKFITYSLAFSISIMIGISITDLIPTSLFNILIRFKLFYGLFIFLICFFLGFIAIYILNKLMKNQNNSLYKLGILSMIALLLHNFPEGIATFIGSVQDINLGLKLSLAIMFHNIPEGISIAVPIYYATKSKKKALTTTLLSGLAEPLGALIAYLFLKNYITDTMISIVLLFVAGIMITLSIEEMLPKAISYRENKFIYFGFISGIILIILGISSNILFKENIKK